MNVQAPGYSRRRSRLPSRGAARGFTLIELMIVATIVGISLVIAAPNIRSFVADQRVRAVAADLAQDIAYARASAVASGRHTIIQPLTTGVWTSGWEIYTDVNGDNAYTAGTDLLLKQAAPTTGTLKICSNVTEFTTGAPNNVIFKPDGSVVRSSPVTPNDGITVSDTMGSANSNDYKIRTLYFAYSGRITAVLQNGQTNGGVACP